jgi:hypothetical protein
MNDSHRARRPGADGVPARLVRGLFGSAFYRVVGGGALFLAVLSLYAAYQTSWLGPVGASSLSGWGLAVLFFWIFAPPGYFFLEYLATEESRRPGLKEARELASPIWAAVLAALLFKLAK